MREREKKKKLPKKYHNKKKEEEVRSRDYDKNRMEIMWLSW